MWNIIIIPPSNGHRAINNALGKVHLWKMEHHIIFSRGDRRLMSFRKLCLWRWIFSPQPGFVCYQVKTCLFIWCNILILETDRFIGDYDYLIVHHFAVFFFPMHQFTQLWQKKLCSRHRMVEKKSCTHNKTTSSYALDFVNAYSLLSRAGSDVAWTPLLPPGL